MSTARASSPPIQSPVVAAPAKIESVPEPKRRRPVVIVALLGALGAAAVVGYAALNAGRETTDDAFVEADILSVQAEVGGRVTEVRVHDDQPINAGDVILKLDSRELEAKVAAARAELAVAEAEVRASEAQELITEASAQGGLSA